MNQTKTENQVFFFVFLQEARATHLDFRIWVNDEIVIAVSFYLLTQIDNMPCIERFFRRQEISESLLIRMTV